MRAHLLPHRGLADHEHRRARVTLAQVARQHQGRVDHVVGLGRHPEAGELGRVLRARLQRLVGEEGHPASRLAQGRDGPVRTGDQPLAQVDGAVEIEEPAAIRKAGDRDLQLSAGEG